MSDIMRCVTVNDSAHSAAALAQDTTSAVLQAVLVAVGHGVGSKGWREMKAEVA